MSETAASDTACAACAALTVSTGPDRSGWMPRRQRVMRRRVSHRWRYVLELHLSGKKVEEIAELTGYKPATIYGILRDDGVNELRAQHMKRYDQEFEALYPKVVDSIRDGLDHSNADVQKEARRDWLKAHGKYRDVPAANAPSVFSAEQMVVNILQQARDERIAPNANAD